MKAKKLRSLLLCALLLASLVLSGCGSTTEETAVPTEAPAATEAPATEAPTAEGTETPEAAGEDTGLPIVDEYTEISFWFEMSPAVVTYLDDMNDNITWQLIEELTGVHVNFQSVSEETAQMFNIMIAGGDICDIMVWGSNYYAGGAAKGIEDGVFLELTDVIDQYMPNYKALREADVDVAAQTQLSDGTIGGIYTIDRGVSKPGTGPIVRADWLEDLGIDPESIVTYEDYYNMLTAFKVEKGATSALHLSAYGAPQGNYLVAGYGIAGYSYPDMNQAPFYQVDGEVRYGLIQPEYKEYLTMLNQWYSEGLFNSDFVNNTNPMQITPEEVTDGSVGLWYHMSQIMEEHVSQAIDPDFDSIAIRDAVKEEGDKTTLANYTTSRVSGNCANISADCENVEVVAKWLDWFYSEQGSLISSYGVEGETYTIDENGDPHFTDLIVNNPEMGMIVAANVYAMQTAVNWNYQDRWYDGYTPAALEAGDIWMEALDLENLATIPDAVILTGEDASTYSLVYADISTYVLENIPQFIMGTRSLDEFDAFVAQIEEMDIQTCIDCWQRAYDDYQNAKAAA